MTESPLIIKSTTCLTVTLTRVIWLYPRNTKSTKKEHLFTFKLCNSFKTICKTHKRMYMFFHHCSPSLIHNFSMCFLISALWDVISLVKIFNSCYAQIHLCRPALILYASPIWYLFKHGYKISNWLFWHKNKKMS